MKKQAALLITGLLLTGTLSACGSSDTNTNSATNAAANTTSNTTSTNSTQASDTNAAAPKLSGKIVFATGRTDKADTTLTDAAKDFMRQNPGTEIVVEAVKDINTIKTRMAAGELPDITQVPNEILKDQYSEYFAPLDDMGFSKDDLLFYDTGLGADGKLYAVTSAVNYDGVVYNKKAFQAAGIDKAPATLDELYADADKLKAKDIVPFASNFKDGWPLTVYLTNLFQYANTGNGNYNNDLVTKPFLSDDGGNLAGLQFLRTMKDKGYLEKDLLSTNWDASKRDIASGKIAMSYLATWFPPQVVENGAKVEDIGMFPLPGGKGVSASADWKYAVSKDSANLDLAKAFYKYLFKDGVFAAKTDVISPMKSAKVDLPYLTELLSGNPTIIEANADSAAFTSLKNKSQIDTVKLAQEYMLKNPDDTVKKYNDLWAKAQKAAK